MFHEMKFGDQCAVVTYDARKNVHITIDRVLALYLFNASTSLGISRWIDETLANEMDDFNAFLIDLNAKGITRSEDLPLNETPDANTDSSN